MNALICNVALAVFFLGGVMFGRWLDSRFKGFPTTDETARSYLFYMSMLKDLNSLNDAALMDAFVNDSLRIKENLFRGTSDPVAFEFFFKWEESIQARKVDAHDESDRYADGHGGPKTNQGRPGGLASAGAETNDYFARAMRMARLSVDSMYGEGSFDKGFEGMRMDRMLRKLKMNVRLNADTNLTLDVGLASPVPRVYLTTHVSMDD